jgi:hypothetical protein
MMAEYLMRTWSLAVLRVRLDLTERTPAVRTELASYAGPAPRSLWSRRYPLEAFGLRVSAGPPTELTVPVDLRDRVSRSLQDDLAGEASLWLRLESPSGYLPAVPWEQALIEVADVPLLRVPDQLPAAPDPGLRWSVAVAVSAAAGSTWAAPYVISLVDALERAVEAEVEVDVFTDAETARHLLDAGWPRRDLVHLHRPEDARQVSDARAKRGVSQFRRRRPTVTSAGGTGRIWADWIADGLGERAARALHVVLDGVWDEDRPLLAVSPEPTQSADPRTCTFVTADDVRLLADVVGAATLSFGSPPDNRGDTATRVVADEVGRQRPGPTIYSSLRLDPEGSALARMHRFIAAQHGEVPLPLEPSLFAYLQPEQVNPWLSYPDAARNDESAAPIVETIAPPDGFDVPHEADMSDWYASSETVPSWVATSERYIGSKLAELGKSAAAPERATLKEAYDRGTAEALSELQQIVAKHARPS